MKSHQTLSSRETQAFGEAVAKDLLRKKLAKKAVVFALQGDLGAGKTTFVQGFLRGLGFKKRAQSPTFIIMRRHRLPKGRAFTDAFHIDAYRLKSADHLSVLGFNEILADPRNVILVEWPERIAKLLPRGTHRITFSHGRKETVRKIAVK